MLLDLRIFLLFYTRAVLGGKTTASSSTTSSGITSSGSTSLGTTSSATSVTEAPSSTPSTIANISSTTSDAPGETLNDKGNTIKTAVYVIVPLAVVDVVLAIVLFLLWRRLRKKNASREAKFHNSSALSVHNDSNGEHNVEIVNPLANINISRNEHDEIQSLEIAENQIKIETNKYNLTDEMPRGIPTKAVNYLHINAKTVVVIASHHTCLNEEKYEKSSNVDYAKGKDKSALNKEEKSNKETGHLCDIKDLSPVTKELGKKADSTEQVSEYCRIRPNNLDEHSYCKLMPKKPGVVEENRMIGNKSIRNISNANTEQLSDKLHDDEHDLSVEVRNEYLELQPSTESIVQETVQENTERQLQGSQNVNDEEQESKDENTVHDYYTLERMSRNSLF